MYLLALAVLFIIIVEIYSIYTKSHPQKSKKRTFKNPKINSRFAYLFIGTSILALYTIWIYILNVKLYGGPHFILGFFIGIPFYLIIFGVMAHAARAVIKKIYFDNRLFTAAVILAVVSIVISLIEISIAIK